MIRLSGDWLILVSGKADRWTDLFGQRLLDGSGQSFRGHRDSVSEGPVLAVKRPSAKGRKPTRCGRSRFPKAATHWLLGGALTPPEDAAFAQRTPFTDMLGDYRESILN
jgi:hypothetical protein